ncbi:MAG: ribosome maturation factor RimM [Schleiferiaceae bacterium]|nr:ribosome maturation factor RimM [Schleiferiaceae bacterium]
MLIEDCFELGIISRKHGFKGGVVAKLDTDQPEKYENLESVFLYINGELIPFFIAQSQLLPSKVLRIQFEGIQTEEAADQLLGAKVYLPTSFLPPLSGKKFYFHEVVGFQVMDKEYGIVGAIKVVLERPPQPVFVIQNNDREILIPAIDEFIDSIDREQKIVYLHAPEGLINLYL